MFFAEIGLHNDSDKKLNDDDIEDLILPLNEPKLRIHGNLYSLHCNLCYYVELDDSEDCCSNDSIVMDDNDEPEETLSLELGDDCPSKADFLLYMKDDDSDDCCDQNCNFNNCRLHSWLWLWLWLSYIFPHSDKAIDNKNNKNA